MDEFWVGNVKSKLKKGIINPGGSWKNASARQLQSSTEVSEMERRIRWNCHRKAGYKSKTVGRRVLQAADEKEDRTLSDPSEVGTALSSTFNVPTRPEQQYFHVNSPRRDRC
ncbi:hypothetical protein HPP92_028775 [Vanilla planifolia]|uniref:Uncharacterized protein n=1 Tax=Vanilla planifolia TaxID=51239 RepID=A0A835P647_VANPL|nr:hypothetical protein HPP92_028775 [Vanilla planifolia]KAG0446585.1 hypothetical protein HPP92_028764 [Vanilla planifolia]